MRVPNGHTLRRGDLRFCRSVLGDGRRLRQTARWKVNLFYVIGMLSAAGLFVYLLVALLDAENL
jgi:K+-transporting ATPase KdpF subunit